MSRKQNVLFLCTHNAARSQMAEALLRRAAGEHFEALSAGLEPTQVHPMTRRVLAEFGIDASGLRAKGTKEFIGRVTVDYAIVVCEADEQTCPRLYPFARTMLHWPFEDPAVASGSEAEQMAVFRRVRDEIDGHIRHFIQQHGA